MANHDFDEIWVETSDGQALAGLLISGGTAMLASVHGTRITTAQAMR
jgi:hypothetical protein